MGNIVLRKNRVTANTLIGKVGELTINTTDKTLYIHDGSTTGGFSLFRYNAASGIVTGEVPFSNGTQGVLQTSSNLKWTSPNLLINTYKTFHAGNFIAGTAVSITESPTNTFTIANTGVTSAVAGTGIGVSAATGAVTITNSGVTSIIAGTGITISGSTGAVTITATGGAGSSGVTSLESLAGAITFVDGDITFGTSGATQITATITSTPASTLTGTIPSGVLGNSTVYIGSTAVALNRATANLALTGISSVQFPGSTSGTVTLQAAAIAGTSTITLPATTGTVITTGDTSTVTNTMLAGSITNNKLANSTISGISLGSNLATLTFGSFLTGTSYNGSTAATIAVDATSTNTVSKVVARDASGNFSAGTITATLFSGSGASLTSIPNGALVNSSTTVNGTAISLGSSGTITANTTNSLTFNNAGSGAASGTTFNGSAAQTISYNTIGAPSTTGTNASGTWGISISGNAATASAVAWSGITSKPTTISGFGITNAVTQQDGTRSNLDYNAQLTSGFYNVDASPTNGPAGISYNQLIVAKGTDTGLQISGGFIHEMYYRGWYSSGATFTAWKKLLDSSNYNSYSPTLTGTGASGTWGISITGNATTATTLQTSRNFSITGPVTASSVSFNGSGDVQLASTINTTTLAVNLTTERVGIGTTSPSYKLDVTGDLRVTGTIYGSITGNAANITAYTINQSVGTGNSPSFAGLTVTGLISSGPQANKTIIIDYVPTSATGSVSVGYGYTVNATGITLTLPNSGLSDGDRVSFIPGSNLINSYTISGNGNAIMNTDTSLIVDSAVPFDLIWNGTNSRWVLG